MKKLVLASDDVVEFFDAVRDLTTIPQWVEFKVLCDNKQKEVTKLDKANNALELLAEIDFTVTINESIFDSLPDDLKQMEIDSCLAGVEISESDVLSKNKPDFCVRTGVIKKYGYERIEVLRESIKSLYDKQKEEEDALKAQTKGKRGRKRKEE